MAIHTRPVPAIAQNSRFLWRPCGDRFLFSRGPAQCRRNAEIVCRTRQAGARRGRPPLRSPGRWRSAHLDGQPLVAIEGQREGAAELTAWPASAATLLSGYRGFGCSAGRGASSRCRRCPLRHGGAPSRPAKQRRLTKRRSPRPRKVVPIRPSGAHADQPRLTPQERRAFGRSPRLCASDSSTRPRRPATSAAGRGGKRCHAESCGEGAIGEPPPQSGRARTAG